MVEREEERYVHQLLAKRFKLELRKLPEAAVKTVDYELLDSGQRVAVVEVKRLDRTPRTPENGWQVTVRDGITYSTRIDNAPARVGRVIHDAFKQLSQYEEAKILVFVNDELMMDVYDLDEAYNGFLNYGDDVVGYANWASRKIANGDIREEKTLMDLYIWLERLRPQEPAFRFATAAGQQLAQRYFGCPVVGDRRTP
jgi:hypothetical protein